MGLFSDPLVLVDAQSNNRSFTFRAQLNEPGSTVGEYIETAAAIASASKLVVKHSATKAGVKRHLLQRAEVFDLTDDPTDGSAPIVVNVTISHNQLAAHNDVQDQVTLMIQCLQQSGFVANLTRELI